MWKPWEPGSAVSSLGVESRDRTRARNVQAERAAESEQPKVSLWEGNGLKREGETVFGAFHSTDEIGELNPSGPGGGKGKPTSSILLGET